MFDGTYEDYCRANPTGASKTATLTREQWEMMRSFNLDARRNRGAMPGLDQDDLGIPDTLFM